MNRIFDCLPENYRELCLRPAVTRPIRHAAKRRLDRLVLHSSDCFT